MKKTVVALLLCAAFACPAMGASNDANVKIINTNYIDGLIAKRDAAFEGNYPMKQKCQEAREVQKLMENFINSDLDMYNLERIVNSRRYIMGLCIGK